MVDFPYELWLHIASFLPKDQIWALRGLNRSLRDIAMDSHYRAIVVSMDSTTSKDYRRGLLRFRDVDIAKRVREITYYTYALADFPQMTKVSRTTKTLLPIKHRIRNYFKNDKSLAVSVIEGFTEIRRLKIDFDYLRYGVLRECIPLFHASLQSPCIQSISFAFPFDLMGVVVPPSCIFPRLNSFSMTLFTLPEKAEVDRLFLDTTTTTLVPFLNRHRQTLTSVDLKLVPLPPTWSMILPIMCTNFNLSPLFKSLDHIPQLQKLSVSISSSTKPDCIARFLKMHTNTLRQITFSMTDPLMDTTRGVLDQFESPWPHLETFEIEYHDHPPYPAPFTNQETTLSFIRQHASSLISLKMLKCRLGRDEVLAFLGPPVSYPKLRYLKMGLQILTPELLDLFASSLPELHELDLLVRFFKRRHTSPLEINEEYEFSCEIGYHDYCHWKLKHFTLIVDNNRSRRSQTRYGSAAVAEAMPFLQTFNGISWKQYMREATSVLDSLPLIRRTLTESHMEGYHVMALN